MNDEKKMRSIAVERFLGLVADCIADQILAQRRARKCPKATRPPRRTRMHNHG